jgi:hypothetical protein
MLHAQGLMQVQVHGCSHNCWQHDNDLGVVNFGLGRKEGLGHTAGEFVASSFAVCVFGGGGVGGGG